MTEIAVSMLSDEAHDSARFRYLGILGKKMQEALKLGGI